MSTLVTHNVFLFGTTPQGSNRFVVNISVKLREHEYRVTTW